MSGLLNIVHSGDMGDIIAGLGAIRDVCELNDAKARIFLDTTGGTNDKWCLKQSQGKGLKFNQKSFEFLRPLIEEQPYVADCNDLQVVQPLNVDINMNAFRSLFFNKDMVEQTNTNLLFTQQIICGVEMGYKRPWLTVPNDGKNRKVAVARSNRYHSSDALYLINADEIESDGAFIGTELEHKAFKDCTRIEVPQLFVKDALALAQAIQNSDKFIVNGTLAYWIAVGLGHPNIWHEIGVDIPTTYFPNQTPPINYVMGNRKVN